VTTTPRITTSHHFHYYHHYHIRAEMENPTQPLQGQGQGGQGQGQVQRYEGTILRIRTTIHNIKQGSTFIIANIRNPWGDEHTIRGTACQRPEIGDFISGLFVQEVHPQYGEQLTTKSNIDVHLPRDPRAIKKRVKDIMKGKSLITAVVRTIDTFAESNPVGFWKEFDSYSVPAALIQSTGGLASIQIEDVKCAIRAYKENRHPVASSVEIERYFMELGLPWSSVAIRRMLGYDDNECDDPENPPRDPVSLEELQADPLCIIELLTNTIQVSQYLAALLRLEIIDEPTAKIGERIKECMMAESSGSCCVPFVKTDANESLRSHPSFDEYLALLERSETNCLLFRKRVFNDEKTVADFIVETATMKEPLGTFDVDRESILHQLTELPPDGDKLPNTDQLTAVTEMLTRRISTVRGSAGTGKTTALRLLARFIKQFRPELCGSILFLAPTGKAVNRMKDSLRDIELSGSDNIMTLHRYAGMLGSYDQKEDGNRDGNGDRDRDREIEGCVKSPVLIVVDESSMISLSTMAMFIRAVRLYRVYIPHIVFIGDGIQLMPVGAGTPYLDMIESKIVTNTTLSVVYRQGPQSALLTAITDLREAVDVTVSEPGTFEISLVKDIAKPMLRWIDSMKASNGERTTSIIVPTGMKGLVGSLTPIVLDYVNPASADVNLYAGQELLDEYRKGDKVMQIVNNYGRSVFNGEVGEIIGLITKEPDAIPPFQLHVRFNGRPDENFYYSLTEAAEELQPAYVLTTHKSQGSEYDDVLIIMDKPIPNFIHRNHIYTAASRGKKSVKILITQREIMRLWKFKPTKPLTGLVYRLCRS
jgi:hypothetical protein